MQLARQVADSLERECRLEFLESRNEVVHAFSDHSKVRSAFRPPPPISLSQGIDRMAAWVKSRGAATPVVFDNIEIVKKLPASWR